MIREKNEQLTKSKALLVLTGQSAPDDPKFREIKATETINHSVLSFIIKSKDVQLCEAKSENRSLILGLSLTYFQDP